MIRAGMEIYPGKHSQFRADLDKFSSELANNKAGFNLENMNLFIYSYSCMFAMLLHWTLCLILYNYRDKLLHRRSGESSAVELCSAALTVLQNCSKQLHRCFPSNIYPPLI